MLLFFHNHFITTVFKKQRILQRDANYLHNNHLNTSIATYMYNFYTNWLSL